MDLWDAGSTPAGEAEVGRLSREGGTITEATSWATVITTSPLFTLFHCLPHCHSHTARHTHMYELKHSALRERERQKELWGLSSDQLSPPLTVLVLAASHHEPQHQEDTRQTLNRSAAIHTGRLTHTCRHMMTHTFSHSPACTKPRGKIESYVRCARASVLKVPLTCCPETCLSAPAAWRTISRSSESLCSSEICSHKEEKDITHREKATTAVMIRTVRRIRDYARAPKTVCSSADARLSFQETSLSSSQWRRWSVDTCQYFLLLSRRLVVRAQAGTVVVLATVGSSVCTQWSERLGHFQKAADVLVSKANPSEV